VVLPVCPVQGQSTLGFSVDTSKNIKIGMTGLTSGANPCRSELAPGGVPTMADNDNATNLAPRSGLRFIASKLAPGEGGVNQ